MPSFKRADKFISLKLGLHVWRAYRGLLIFINFGMSMCFSLLLVETRILIVWDYKYVKPNVMVEWLTLLLRIREVPGSNLSPEAGYPD
jgi:hypothetical protein